MNDTVVIVQARMQSTRLPYKAMLDLEGKPMLEHVINRCRAADVGSIIVATTMCKADLAISKRCEKLKTSVFMGDEYNVLHRFYKAALLTKARHIVRITGDCPMIDPKIIKDTVGYYWHETPDYCASRMSPEAFPDGMDVEVFTFDALKEAYEQADTKDEREHVTPWIKDIGLFTCEQLPFEKTYPLSLKLSVDTAEDYKLTQKIFARLYAKNPLFGLDEIMEAL